MDNQALAETYVTLYHYVADNYEAQTGTQSTTEVANMIFEQTCKRIISDLIGKQRSGVPSKQESTGDSKPSEKQVAFAKKLGCHNPEGFSKYELSQWIDDNKKF